MQTFHSPDDDESMEEDDVSRRRGGRGERRERNSDYRPDRKKRVHPQPGPGVVRYRIEVGRNHGVMPKDIVGAIANEAGIEYDYIGYIGLEADYSTVDLPEGMPKEIFQHLKKIRVRQHPLNISVDGAKMPAPDRNSAGESARPGARDTGFDSLKRRIAADNTRPESRSPVKPGSGRVKKPHRGKNKQRKAGKQHT